MFLHQEEVKEIVESLGIPFESLHAEVKVASFSSTAKLMNSFEQIISHDICKDLWAKWNPNQPERMENPDFLSLFREMLIQGASLGLRMDRFIAVSTRLPDPSTFRAEWRSLFEEAVGECSLTVRFAEQDFQQWVTAESADDQNETLIGKVKAMMEGIYYELGILCPIVQFQSEHSLPPHHFRLGWNDIIFPPQRGLAEDELLVNDTVDRLKLQKIEGKVALNPADGKEWAIIAVKDRESALKAGLTTYNFLGHFILVLSSQIIKHASAFVNRLFLDLQLYRMEDKFPATVAEVQQRLSKDLLVQILRELVREEISIRNLRLIFDYLCQLQPDLVQANMSQYIIFDVHGAAIISPRSRRADLAVYEYVNMVRAQLKKEISYKFTRGATTLVVYLMDTEVEAKFSRSEGLSQNEVEGLIRSVKREMFSTYRSYSHPIILTTMEARYPLRKVLTSSFPEITVLSYQELSPNMNIQPVARIHIDDD